MRCSAVGAQGDIGPVQEFIARLRRAAEELGLEAQAFDADLVFGAEHLLVAWDHAERAFARGTNVASDRMMEVLRFAAGERQITAALEKLGLKADQDGMALLVVGTDDPAPLLRRLGLQRADDLLAGRIDMLPAFGVRPEEIETVERERVFDLVLERVALTELGR